MKIVLLGTSYPYRGGLASFNERLVRQFQDEGFDAEIFTFTVQYPSLLFPGKTQYSNEPAPDNLRITRCVNSVNPFNWIKVGRKLMKSAPDIVIIKFWIPLMAPCFGTIARIAKRNKKTKIVSILDNIVPHEKRWGDKLLAKYFVKSVDAFVAMSKSVKDDLAAFDTVKPRLLMPHPVFDNFGSKIDRKTALLFLKLDENQRYMLFFGIIRDYKGLDLLLQAFSDERFKCLNVKLIVAGEFYNDEERYRKMEQDLNLKDRIIWFDKFIPDSEVRYFFNAADIIVQPYKSATQSGVTQIGYHFERPMLVTDVGGLKEIIPDGKVGYVVKPQADSIAEALLDFFTHDRMKEFEDNLKEEKKKYSWANMTHGIIEVARK